MGSRPAHHAGVAFDGVKLHPTTTENLAVGFVVKLIIAIQSFPVHVQAIGVLHQELPGPQQTPFGTGLVPQFGLNLVPDLGKVAVGPNFP